MLASLTNTFRRFRVIVSPGNAPMAAAVPTPLPDAAVPARAAAGILHVAAAAPPAPRGRNDAVWLLRLYRDRAATSLAADAAWAAARSTPARRCPSVTRRAGGPRSVSFGRRTPHLPGGVLPVVSPHWNAAEMPGAYLDPEHLDDIVREGYGTTDEVMALLEPLFDRRAELSDELRRELEYDEDLARNHWLAGRCPYESDARDMVLRYRLTARFPNLREARAFALKCEWELRARAEVRDLLAPFYDRRAELSDKLRHELECDEDVTLDSWLAARFPNMSQALAFALKCRRELRARAKERQVARRTATCARELACGLDGQHWSSPLPSRRSRRPPVRYASAA